MMDALDLAVKTVSAFEGCRLRAYRDIVGVWTIGWGETAGVRPGMVWTQEQADIVLRRRTGHFLLAVLQRCQALHLEGPERQAACVSLAYNIGIGAFGASSVCRKTMAQDFAGAADSFLLWDKAGGRRIEGLVRRRKAERALYLS
ncbi:MAG: lysozyme [Burkholderiaceae bacterium]|nr:lysozyme [Burkholderiaceae bacterium]